MHVLHRWVVLSIDKVLSAADIGVGYVGVNTTHTYLIKFVYIILLLRGTSDVWLTLVSLQHTLIFCGVKSLNARVMEIKNVGANKKFITPFIVYFSDCNTNVCINFSISLWQEKECLKLFNRTSMKRQGLTGSLEEIATSSSSSDRISRQQQERHTIQNTPRAHVFSLQNLQLNDSRRNNKIPPTIPEVESTSSDVRINIEKSNSVRGSQSSLKSGKMRTGSTSTNKSRRESLANSSNKSRKESTPGVFENKGYEGSVDNLSLGSTRSFERSRAGSDRTTTTLQSLG